MVVKFVDRKEGYVIHPGTSNNELGSFHTDWRAYYEDCWEPYEYTGSTKTPDQLELFESTTISSSATITKVPNGYVMTSRSGHQILIPSNLI